MLLLSTSACDKCDSDLLKNNTWILQSYGPNDATVAVLDPSTLSPPGNGVITLSFNATDGQVNGKDGCNSYFGDFTQDKCSLKFGTIASTKMLCQGPVMAQSNAYMNIFTAAVTFSTANNQLEISTADERVLIYKKQ